MSKVLRRPKRGLSKFAFVLDGETKECVCAFNPQLAANIGAVILDRAVVNGERCADLLARQSVRDEHQNPAFRRRKASREGILVAAIRRIATLEQLKSDGGTDVYLPAHYRLHRGYDLLHRAVFQQVAVPAGVERGAHHLFILMEG